MLGALQETQLHLCICLANQLICNMERQLVGFKSKKTGLCFPALVLPDGGAFEVQIVQDICIKDYAAQRVCLGGSPENMECDDSQLISEQ